MNQIPNIEETHNTREVQPTESQALPHENIIKKCWNPDCRKVATCRDGSGWEWCDDHVDQEKTGSVLHTAQEYYDVDYYTALLKERIHQQLQKARYDAWQEAVDLADKIELQEPDGGTKQWMAFKAFRNTLRDKIKDHSELNQPNKQHMSKNSETHSVCNKHNIGGDSVCCECSGKTDCSNYRTKFGQNILAKLEPIDHFKLDQDISNLFEI